MSWAPPRHSVTFSPVISTWMPPGWRAQRAVHLEEALHLVDDAVEVAGLVAGRRLVGVAVHRVALPDDLMAGGLHLLDDRRQQVAHLVVAQPADQRQPPRLVVRIEPLDVLDGQLRRHRRADLDADRVGDHLGEGDVRAVELAGALPDPHVVRRQVVQLRRAGRRRTAAASPARSRGPKPHGWHRFRRSAGSGRSRRTRS